MPFFLLLTSPYHFSLFSVILFVTDATFTDPFTSFFVTPHIHLSIPISITSSLLSWLFVVSHVSEPYTQWTIIIVAMVICQVMSPVTVSHFDDITIFPPPRLQAFSPLTYIITGLSIQVLESSDRCSQNAYVPY